MHDLARPCLVALTLSAAALAQFTPTPQPLGLLNLTNTSFTSRGSAMVPNTNDSYVILRIDKEKYAGWGFNAANPGMREVVGITGILQDQVGNTPELFDLYVYQEDANNPNYPDVGNPVAMATGLPSGPTMGTGPAAFAFTANFATPAYVPATSDVFLGVGLAQPASGSWPTDGLSCHALYYVMVSSGFYDLPGGSHPVGQPLEGNGLWHVDPPTWTAGPQYTTTPRQWKLEPIVNGASGTAGTITNQVSSAALSTAPPGTSSMASGLHPDAANPPLNPGRIDDVASRFYLDGAPANSPVFFTADLSFGPEIPLAAFTAPAQGAVCVNASSALVLGLSFTNNGEAFLLWNLTPAARMFISGVSVVHQSFAIVNNVGYANGCTMQTF